MPMGGNGTRFSNAGYNINKACIPTTDRHSGKKLPMVICAMKDIPGINNINNRIICVCRDFHQRDGLEEIIKKSFTNTTFIHDHVLLDQAFGCFLAREFLDCEDELFIGACDNGFVYNDKEFSKAKSEFDVLMISHSNDSNIEQNPNAHSWAKLRPNSQELELLSLKKPISDNPMKDHATTGMFWFKKASDFLNNLEKMIWKRDTLDGKYYVDKVLNYCIRSKLRVGYFDVKYICWGTPTDYENYENTIAYWKNFIKKEGI